MMQEFKTPFCYSKFPWTREIISLEVIDNLDTHSQNSSPALDYPESFSWFSSVSSCKCRNSTLN
jgi:hypothetical protein